MYSLKDCSSEEVAAVKVRTNSVLADAKRDFCFTEKMRSMPKLVF